MPLTLRPPRPGRSPYYEIRGTYLGVSIERSSRTGDKSLKKKILKSVERDIERGVIEGPGSTGFAAAAAAYMKAGGERRPLRRLIEHFKNRPLVEIDQIAIDNAADTLMPNATAATRNREIYTPISAVLKRAGFDAEIKRPKGWRGTRLTHWLKPEETEAIFRATAKIDAPEKTRVEFRIFLRVLCYTGMRLGDGLGLQCDDVDLRAHTALIRKTKNGKPRLAHLPPVVVQDLKLHPRGLKRPGKRLFRFHASGRLRELFQMTCEAAGVVLPRRVAFHVFCHTWATWMRRYGGLDTFDLVRTDRWADSKSADAYTHVVVSEQSKRADLLPGAKARSA